MSKLFIEFLTADQLKAIHDAGHAVEQIALFEGQKLVATLKEASIGAARKAIAAAGATLPCELFDLRKDGLPPKP